MSNKPFGSKGGGNQDDPDEDERPASGSSSSSGLFNRPGSGDKDKKPGDPPSSSRFNSPLNSRSTGPAGKPGSTPSSKAGEPPKSGPFANKSSFGSSKADEESKPSSGLFGSRSGSGSKDSGDKKDDKPGSGLFGRSSSDKPASDRPGSGLFNRGSDKADKSDDDRPTGSFGRFGSGDKPGSKPADKRDDKSSGGGLFGRGSDRDDDDDDEEDFDDEDKTDNKPVGGSLFGRFGGDKPGSKPADKKEDKPASGGLFGRPGSDKPKPGDDKTTGTGSFPRFGGDKPGSKPADKDKPASGGLFGRPGSDKAKPGDKKEEAKPASGGLFGRFGGGDKSAAKPDAKADKKDDKPASGGLFGRVGGSAKPADDKKEDKPAGGLLGRFGGGKGESKPEAPASAPRPGAAAAKPAEKKEDKPAGGGGLFNRFRGGEGKVDDKAAKPDAKADDRNKPTSGTFPRPPVGDTKSSPSSLPRIGGTPAARPDDRAAPKPLGGATTGPQRPGAPAGKPADKAPAKPGGVGGLFSRLRGGGKSEAAATDKRTSGTALVPADRKGTGALSDISGAPKVAGGDKRGVPPARLDNKQAKPLDRSLTQVTVKRHGLSLDQKLDISGYALIAAAAIIFFGLIQPDPGTLPKTVADILGGFFGYARYVMPIPLLVIGGWLLIRYFKENPFLELDLKRISGLALMFLTFVTTLHFFELLYKVVDTMPQLEQVSAHAVDLQQGGGWVGDRLYMLLIQLTGENGVAVVLVACWIISIYLAFEISFADVSTYIKSIASWFGRLRRGFVERRRHWVEGRVAKRQQAQAISLQRPATAGAIPASATLAGPAAIGPATDKKNAAASPARSSGPLPAVSSTAKAVPAAEAVMDKSEAPLQAPVARPAPAPIGSRAAASTPAPAALKTAGPLAAEAESVKTGETAADDLESQPVKPGPVKQTSTGLFGRGGDKDENADEAPEPEKVKPAPIATPAAKAGGGLFGRAVDKADEEEAAPDAEKEPLAEKPKAGLFGARPAASAAAAPSARPGGLFGKAADKPDEAAPEPEKARPGPFSAKPAALGSAPSTPAAKSGGGVFDKPDEKAGSPKSDVEKPAISGTSRPGGSLFGQADDEVDEEETESAPEQPAEKPKAGLLGSKPAPVAGPDVEKDKSSDAVPQPADKTSEEADAVPDNPTEKPRFSLFGPKPASSPPVKAGSPPAAAESDANKDKPASVTPQPGDKAPDKVADAVPDKPAEKPRFGLFGSKPASSPAVKAGDQADSSAEKDKAADGARPGPFSSRPAAPAARSGGGLFGKVGESTPEKGDQPGDAQDKPAEKPGSSPFGAKPTTPGGPFARRSEDANKDKPAETKGDDAKSQPPKPGPFVGRSSGVFGAAPKPGAAQAAPVVDDKAEDDDALEYEPLDDVTVDDAEEPAPGGPPFKPAAPGAASRPAVMVEPDPPKVETPPARPGPSASLSGASRPDSAPAPVAKVNRPVQVAEPPVEGVIVRSKSSAGWTLPDFHELLEAGSQQTIQDEVLRERARIIEETLQSFGAPGKVVEINPGPVITQFGVEPDYLVGRQGKRTRVKVSSIAKLDADLALALAARTIRIEAPVPGKSYVGIEVPNPETALVGLRDIMADSAFNKIKSKLRIALGQSIDGASVVADLTQMPHLLIAGTTGSGKSVCVNAIISCLLLENAPDDLQLIMIDPKRVELTSYNGIPHLVSPVVVDLERIVGVLKWVTREMDERYKRFSAAGARNITDFNGRLKETDKKMPYLVVVVDELADLMMLAPDETEKVLTRLAQMARATGIHLIISTQRPSVDVVTGLIKANFPARISFAVASSVDSRVVLDQPGAEKLLGRGDMLYQAPDAAAPSRIQGVFVSDAEINRITRYWKEAQLSQRESKPAPVLSVSSFDASDKPSGKNGDEPPPGRAERLGPIAISGSSANTSQKAFFDAIREPEPSKDDGDGGEDDEMYAEAVALFKKTNKVSISLLQRRLRIGFTRAARLIDLMKQRGVLGANDVSTSDTDDES